MCPHGLCWRRGLIEVADLKGDTQVHVLLCMTLVGLPAGDELLGLTLVLCLLLGFHRPVASTAEIRSRRHDLITTSCHALLCQWIRF